ncbi:MAG: exodeoxyribonuclease III [Acidimicrobiales bacterium]|nr:exodeoxyribonuclease III [Acidimicrobiales bacterium]
MRIATWNVNSIRARIGAVRRWLVENSVDVCCLQETRCADGGFPFTELTDLGYEVAHHGIDHWNGVAIISRVGLEGVERGFRGVTRAPFDEARLIGATCDGVRVHSVYVPNGRELWDPHYAFKLVFLERLRSHLQPDLDAGVPTVLGGDLNVAPHDRDIYDPSRWRRRTHASPPERAGITALCDLGLHDIVRDLHPDEACFTWWSHRPQMYATDRGLRIDLLLASGDLAEATTQAWVDRAERGRERSSDHAPVVVDIEGELDATATSAVVPHR